MTGILLSFVLQGELHSLRCRGRSRANLPGLEAVQQPGTIDAMAPRAKWLGKSQHQIVCRVDYPPSSP